jgi:hypothetical protein
MKYLKKFLEATEIKHENNLTDVLFKGNFKEVDNAANLISQEWGYKIIKKLGEGSWGIAYLLDDNKVLKLTLNKKEVQYAYKFSKRHTKNLTNYYNVIKVNYGGLIFFALLMDYVYPLTKEEKKIYEDISIRFFYYSDLIEGITNPEDLKIQIEDFTHDMKVDGDWEKYDKKFIYNVFKQIRNIALEVKKYKIVDPWEMHSDNLGKKIDGDWVYFDVIVKEANVDISKIKTLEL